MELTAAELEVVRNYAEELPPHAFYLAGAAKFKTGLSVKVILWFLRALYQRERAGSVAQEVLIEVEKKIYEGKLGEAKGILDQFMVLEPTVHLEDSVKCGLCGGGMEVGEYFMPENCGDLFHAGCFKEFAEKQLTSHIECPLCKNVIGVHEFSNLPVEVIGKKLCPNCTFQNEPQEGKRHVKCDMCMTIYCLDCGQLQCKCK